MSEIWKDIEGYEDCYQVSNKGRIKSMERIIIRSDGFSSLLKQKYKVLCANRHGYLKVDLCQDTKRTCYSVHRLVALAFLPEPVEDRDRVNHIDGCKNNNNLENLEWSSQKENVQHAYTILGRVSKKGENHGNSSLTRKQVVYIRNNHALYGSRKDIAELFNVKVGAINKIIRRFSWKHVPIWEVNSMEDDKEALNTISSEENVHRRLTTEDVASIRSSCIVGDEKFGITALAKKYSVGTSSIHYIVNNKTYTNI